MTNIILLIFLGPRRLTRFLLSTWLLNYCYTSFNWYRTNCCELVYFDVPLIFIVECATAWFLMVTKTLFKIFVHQCWPKIQILCTFKLYRSRSFSVFWVRSLITKRTYNIQNIYMILDLFGFSNLIFGLNGTSKGIFPMKAQYRFITITILSLYYTAGVYYVRK